MFFLQEQEQGTKPVMEPMLSIRRKILALESVIAPELKDPQKVLDESCDPAPVLKYQYFPHFVEQKWLLILQKHDNPRVKQLIQLMETAHIPQEIFCKILAEFSVVPLKNINLHARLLGVFTPDEIEYCLQRHFSVECPYDLNLVIKSVTHVLMKA